MSNHRTANIAESHASLNEAKVKEVYGQLPLSFEQNAGQTDARVKFLSRGQGYGLFLTADEAVLSLRKEQAVKHKDGTIARPSSSINVLKMKVAGANREA